MQKHAVLTWELGSGYGHVMGFKELIEKFLQQGFQVSVISRNVVSAGTAFSELAVPVYQAPFFIKDGDSKIIRTFSYSDILYNVGYKNADDLHCLVSSWCNLFDFIKPDVLVADHSPTAVLAAMCRNIKAATYGTGFFIPPNKSRLPLFQPVQKTLENETKQRELHILENINFVLNKFKKPPKQKVGDLFSESINFLCTLKELDHYTQIRNLDESHYAGPRFNIDAGTCASFSAKQGNRIFAYVKEHADGFDKLMEALARSVHEVILHIPQPSEKLVVFCSRQKNMRLFAEPVQVSNMLKEADLFICHAGHGLVCAGLLGGKPMLLLPMQLEQSILAQQLARQKLVAALDIKKADANYAAAIHFGLSSTVLKNNAQNFAKKYSELSTDDTVSVIVDKCSSLVN